jgi:hypothetical protein
LTDLLTHARQGEIGPTCAEIAQVPFDLSSYLRQISIDYMAGNLSIPDLLDRIKIATERAEQMWCKE